MPSRGCKLFVLLSLVAGVLTGCTITGTIEEILDTTTNVTVSTSGRTWSRHSGKRIGTGEISCGVDRSSDWGRPASRSLRGAWQPAGLWTAVVDSRRHNSAAPRRRPSLPELSGFSRV